MLKDRNRDSDIDTYKDAYSAKCKGSDSGTPGGGLLSPSMECAGTKIFSKKEKEAETE